MGAFVAQGESGIGSLERARARRKLTAPQGARHSRQNAAAVKMARQVATHYVEGAPRAGDAAARAVFAHMIVQQPTLQDGTAL